MQWRFPATFMEPGSYLLGVGVRQGPHEQSRGSAHQFQTRSGRGILALFGPHTNVISEFDPVYPPQRADVSYGRIPRSSITGFYSVPTPRAANTNHQSSQRHGLHVGRPVFRGRAAPFINGFNLELGTASTNAVIRYVLITNASKPAPRRPTFLDQFPDLFRANPINLTTQISGPGV